MNITLNQILSLFGQLNDIPDKSSPREIFRNFLRENIKEFCQIRYFIEEWVRTLGEQYNRALQDLFNYLIKFLDFEVIFGRYHGFQIHIGFERSKIPYGIY